MTPLIRDGFATADDGKTKRIADGHGLRCRCRAADDEDIRRVAEHLVRRKRRVADTDVVNVTKETVRVIVGLRARGAVAAATNGPAPLSVIGGAGTFAVVIQRQSTDSHFINQLVAGAILRILV